MKRIRYILINISLFVLSISLFATTSQSLLTSFSTKDGLVSNMVNITFQDSKGFLWIGTSSGLSRFDGREFTNYLNNPRDENSINSNMVLGFAEDSKGNLWISTQNGLNKYNYINNNFTSYSIINNSTGLNIEVKVTSIDENDNIWISTEKSGLYIFDIKSKTFDENQNFNTLQKSHAFEGINAFCLMKSKTKYIANGSSLISYNEDQQKYREYLLNNAFRIVDLEISPDESSIWIATINNGIFIFSLAKKSFIAFSNNNILTGKNIQDIDFDQYGKLWVSTKNNGLYYFDIGSNNYQQFKSQSNCKNCLSDNDVHHVFEDQNGIYWVSTLNGLNKLINYDPNGIMRIKSSKFDNNLPDKPAYTYVRSIIKDMSGIIWYGSNHGLVKYDEPRDKVEIFSINGNANALYKDQVVSILEDGEKYLWLGTSEGLIRFDRETNNSKVFINPDKKSAFNTSNYVLSLLQDKNKNIYVGTWDGLWYLPEYERFLDNPAFKFIEINNEDPYSLRDGIIYDIMESKDGIIWLANSTNGLFKLLTAIESNEVKFQNYRFNELDNNSLPSNNLFSLAEDDNGFIWISSFDAGLARFDTELEKYLIFTKDDGLPNNSIVSLLYENSKLWISTLNGLSLLNNVDSVHRYKNEVFSNLFQNFKINDGINEPTLSFGASFHSSNNELLIGSLNGYYSFNTKGLTEHFKEPSIIISDFKLHNKSIFDLNKHDSIFKKDFILNHKIKLNYKQNFFSIRFSALEFISPENINYAYKLEGFNKDWVFIKNKNEINFTNVPPGNFQLKIRFTDRQGTWINNELIISIIITPPWWETLWFKTVAILLLLTFIVIVFYWRTYSLRKRKVALELEIKIRTRELAKAKEVTELANTELQTKSEELEKFNSTMLDREMRIIELKKEINKLAKDSNTDLPYQEVEDE